MADAETKGSAVDEHHPAGSIDADQAAGEIGGGAGCWSDGAAEIDGISKQIAADDSFNANQGIGTHGRTFVENTLGTEGDKGFHLAVVDSIIAAGTTVEGVVASGTNKGVIASITPQVVGAIVASDGVRMPAADDIFYET